MSVSVYYVFVLFCVWVAALRLADPPAKAQQRAVQPWIDRYLSYLNIANRSFENMANFKYLGITLTDQNMINEEIKGR
jgi:hypothetical protein